MFNMTHVEETAKFIAGELRTFLDRKGDDENDGHMTRRLREARPNYESLTNGDAALATLRALSMIQLEVGADLGGLMYEYDDYDDEEDDEDEAAA
jgi:hypothetical protein